jgi:hypothetical protein
LAFLGQLPAKALDGFDIELANFARERNSTLDKHHCAQANNAHASDY